MFDMLGKFSGLLAGGCSNREPLTAAWCNRDVTSHLKTAMRSMVVRSSPIFFVLAMHFSPIFSLLSITLLALSPRWPSRYQNPKVFGERVGIIYYEDDRDEAGPSRWLTVLRCFIKSMTLKFYSKDRSVHISTVSSKKGEARMCATLSLFPLSLSHIIITYILYEISITIW